MPTQTLSAISGVTVYATEAAAKSGAVDSGVAFNAWMRAQTSTAAAPITLLWDGWIYIADMPADFLQYTPNTSGFITHQPAAAIGSNGAGAVWASKSTASPCMRNGAATYVMSTSNISDVTFAENAGGHGLTFDFNCQQGGSQPHDDTTWGLAMGFQAAGMNRLSAIGTAFKNSRCFITYYVGCDGVTLTSVANSVQSNRTDDNTDPFHVNGPCQHIVFSGCSATNTQDDSFALNADEPLYTVPDYTAGLLSGWTGGDINHVSILNCTVTNVLDGVRTLSFQRRLDNILIDGLSGTAVAQIWMCDRFDAGPDYLGGQVQNRIGTIQWRNVNVQASGAFFSGYGSSRMFINADIENLYLDLTTVTPVSADANTVPLIEFTLKSRLPTNLVLGPAFNVVVQDQFNRPNGSVGNGWVGSAGTTWALDNGQLFGSNTGVSGISTLLQTGTVATNGFAISTTQTTQGVDFISVLRQVDVSNNYLMQWYEPTNTVYVGKTVGGVATNLNGGGSGVVAPFTPTVGDQLSIIGAIAGDILLYGVWDVTQECWLYPLSSWIDSSVTSPGTFGIGTNQANSTYVYAGVNTYPAAAALASITVTPDGQDSYGNYLFNAVGNGNAYIGNGAWSTSAGTIDGFGRLRSVPAGQPATVTYTVGAIAGSYTMSSSSPTPTPTPGQTTAFLTCYDGQGNTKSGVVISFVLTNPASSTDAYSQTPVTATSGAGGLLQVVLRRLTNYTATAPNGQSVDFTTSNTTTFALPNLMGQF